MLSLLYNLEGVLTTKFAITGEKNLRAENNMLPNDYKSEIEVEQKRNKAKTLPKSASQEDLFQRDNRLNMQLHRGMVSNIVILKN